MPFKHTPQAMISVVKPTNSSQEAEVPAKGGFKDLPDSETGTPTSSSTDDHAAHGSASADASPRVKSDQTMDDPDKCSTEQAAIASIILQLSQQPAKKRRTRSGGESDMPKLTSSSPVVAPSPSVKSESDEPDFPTPSTQPKASPAPSPAGVQQEGRIDTVSKDQVSPNLQAQVAKQGALPGEANISSSALQAMKQSNLSKAAETRKPYRCSKCGAEKKGHLCSAKTTADTQPSSAQVVEVKRGDLAARLAARLQGRKEGGDSSESKTSENLSGAGASDDQQRTGIMLATTKQDLARIPFVTSYSANEVFDQGVINHPALASGLPILLKCPPEGWARVVHLPSAVPGP
mmetsp:Transcript_34764/g.81854  ORF Transcript_34764/g.81854 Transcript_34764/m.81854 type:complete len:348 (-) Transcript_34764:137-1180(-)